MWNRRPVSDRARMYSEALHVDLRVRREKETKRSFKGQLTVKRDIVKRNLDTCCVWAVAISQKKIIQMLFDRGKTLV